MADYKSYSDEKLMSFLSKGEESAFNELYARYGKRILYFMYKMLQQDEAKAHDLTQDIFIKVIEAVDSFDTSRNFKTWIFTIAANHCKNYFRQNNKLINDSQLAGGPSVVMEDLHDKAMLKNSLETEISKLKSPYKETFLLRYSQDLKMKEIAEIMNCPLGTIKSRINHATKELAKNLNHYHSWISNKTEL